MALFRYSVLGSLVSRAKLERGELKAILQELAARDYNIPGSRNCRLGEKTIEAWYYAWRRGGIEALTPKPRSDRGQSKLALEVQAAILTAKRENPRRSIRGIRRLLESRGTVAKDELSRSTIHRLLQAQGLSRVEGAASEPEEHRAYVAEYAGDIWYGDVKLPLLLTPLTYMIYRDVGNAGNAGAVTCPCRQCTAPRSQWEVASVRRIWCH